MFLSICFSGLPLGWFVGQKECDRDSAPQLGRGVYQRGAGVPIPTQSPCPSLGQSLGAHNAPAGHHTTLSRDVTWDPEAVQLCWHAALEPFLQQCQSYAVCNFLGYPHAPALCTVCSHPGVLVSSSALRGSNSQLQQNRSTLRLMNSHAVVVEAQRIAKVTYAQWYSTIFAK